MLKPVPEFTEHRLKKLQLDITQRVFDQIEQSINKETFTDPIHGVMLTNNLLNHLIAWACAQKFDLIGRGATQSFAEVSDKIMGEINASANRGKECSDYYQQNTKDKTYDN